MAEPKGSEESDIIEPVRPLAGSTAASSASGDGRRLLWMGLAASVAVVGLISVFVWLPSRVEAPAVPVAVEPAAEPEVETTPADPRREAELKNAAEIALSKIVALEGELKIQGVERWAGDDWQAFVDTMNRGDDLFLAQKFLEATTEYEAGIGLGEQLLANVETEFQAAMQAGEMGIQSADPETAIAAFERALVVDPDNERAAAGLDRAQRLTQVLELIQEGERLEGEGRLADAAAAFNEALALDGNWEPTRTALARVSRARAANRYQSAMADGFAALGREDFDGARRAFELALAERSNDRPALDGLAQADQGEKLKAISLARARGSALERLEQWENAVAQYRAALALDDTLAFAREGLARSQERLDLDTKLEALLASPNQLFEPRIRADAKRLIAQSAAFAADSKRLPEQTERLGSLIQAAERPLQVTLLSDLETQVTVYRVGALGQFQEKVLELTPGDYVAVGSRDGFRDVRAEFRVRPGNPPQPVTVICIEPISS